MKQLDLTTIILTYNEEIHIRRCLENVCPFSKKVIVVDSPSTDRTVDICTSTSSATGQRVFPNVEVVVHKYPGNQAEQFNWAIDNLKIDTEWVLRIDADEYCTKELIQEMYAKLPSFAPSVSAVVLPLGRSFRGRLLKHSIVGSVKMIRLFRKGRARYEKRVMDEHLTVLKGKTISFDNMFVDDNLCSIRTFIDKHNGYSNKEAAMLLDAEYDLTDPDESAATSEYAEEVSSKRAQKKKYAKMPLYWRAFGYFFYRYVLKLGFLDGRAGFEWDFFQGLWYRLLIDAKVNEVKRFIENSKVDVNSEDGKRCVKSYIKQNYGIEI